MAISKILYMKDCGTHFHGKHLKQALDYVMNPEKTQNGRLIGGINCQPGQAFEQMRVTKRKFGKADKRQGYHLILSFMEGEVSPDIAYEITQKFVKEYLGEKYEAVFCIHDNTEHIHSHIIFNSVSFLDGKKYRYEKGDWARDIQPITNRLCKEYGLSTINIGDDKNERKEYYKEWNEYRDGNFVWTGMIQRDLDACILQTNSFEEFLDMLREKGYEIKQGKYLAIKPRGMKRFKRCKTLGEEYSEERIRERIQREDISYYQERKEETSPRLIRCYVKRYKRTKLSGLQKRYYAKLYRLGKLKKKPYSQVWKYKDDIKKMQKLQRQYLYLVRHNINNIEDLAVSVQSLTDKKKESASEKSKVYRAKQKFKLIFELADKMNALEPAETSYQMGDEFFLEEHENWLRLEKQLKNEGYVLEEVERLRIYYKKEIKQACEKESAVSKELNIGKSIWKDLVSEDDRLIFDEEKDRNKERYQEQKQPLR